MCEGGQVWGHARRRGYAAAEIWPKSDFDIHCVQIVPGEQGREGGREGGREQGREQGNQNDTFTQTSEGVLLNTTERGSNL